MEILELTRDVRTIFVSQLLVRATEDDVADFFEQVRFRQMAAISCAASALIVALPLRPTTSPKTTHPHTQAGHISRVTLIRDRSSGKSKGMGYVEFSDLESIPAALLLNGVNFCMRHRGCSCSGFPIVVKSSEAEKNYAAAAERAGGSTTSRDAARRIYVCGIEATVTESDLCALAGTVGTVDRAVIISNKKRVKGPGYGFVIFRDEADATLALSQLNARVVGESRITVGRLNELGLVVTITGETVPLSGNKNQGGLNAQTRAAIAARLGAATKEAAQQLSSTVSQTMSAAVAMETAAVAPTNCLILYNCFDPNAETEPNWESKHHATLSERLQRFGPILFSKLDAIDPRGLLFAMLTEESQASAAINALAGSQLGSRTIGATKMPIVDFLARFPDAVEVLRAQVL
jgi:RNA-binding protein 39